MPLFRTAVICLRFRVICSMAKRPVNGTNTVNTAQIWNAGEATVNRKLTGQLGNF